MKQNLSPGVVAGIIAVVVIVAGVLLFKASTGKASYVGENVAPGGGKGMSPDEAAKALNSRAAGQALTK